MNIISSLRQENIPFETEVSCRTLSSFRVGGDADLLIEPRNTDELKKALELLKVEETRFMIIGCGSNLLFSDNGFRGALVRLKSPFSGCELLSDDTISVFAGERLSSLCNFALNHSLSGLEFAFGIPGSLGGAVFMNAGAYGGEICDVFVGATVLTPELVIEQRSADEMDFSYRHSALCDSGDVLISADLRLKKSEQSEISKMMDRHIRARSEKQPLTLPSAGSTFKRPIGGYASALIDECGLKGYSVGGACVSEKHAGFVVNTGGATCDDVLKLCDYIKKIVFEKKNVELELEVAHIL